MRARRTRHSRVFFFFQAEDGIRDYKVTGVQTCALPICRTGIARSNNVDVASGNDRDGIRQGDIADKIIDDAVFFGRRFRRLVAIGSELAKDLVQAWPAQIAVDEQNTMTLLSERKGIVGAGETLPL